jgi:hypothetical protein
MNSMPPIDRAKLLVQAFYIALAYEIIKDIPTTQAYIQNVSFVPVWPLKFLLLLPKEVVIQLVLGTTISGVLAGAMLPRVRLARVAAFAAIFVAHGVQSSLGQPNHQWYPYLYTAALFIFLPGENPRIYTLVIWAAQAWMLLLYSMSGWWKLTTAIQQMGAGQISSFHPKALALQVAAWIPIGGINPPFANIILDYPIIGWAPYLLTMYLQVFALWAAFRPNIQRVWAVGLISFHLGTQLFMGISFTPWILLLMVLFFLSPFYPSRSVWDVVYDLPLIGWVTRRLKEKSRS